MGPSLSPSAEPDVSNHRRDFADFGFIHVSGGSSGRGGGRPPRRSSMNHRALGSVLRYLYRAAGPDESDAPTDGQLLARFVTGREEAAFEALLGRHAGIVWQACRRVLGDNADAHDAFQATFLVLLQRARE